MTNEKWKMTNEKWKMINDQWWSMTMQVRARTRGQNASSRGRKENWSVEVIKNQWLFDVKRCFKSCCVFIICKFQTAVEFGSARVQRKQGPHLPDHQSSRVLNVTVIIIACFFASNIINKRPYFFSCFRDGGKRFDAEFQGSHHQLDKQEIFHMISKWKQRCQMKKMNV